MYLYLVQHAESNPKEEDPERHLSDRGRMTAERVASYLSQYCDIRLHSILHSDKTRALETAQVLGQKLNPLRGLEEAKELGPTSTPWGWVERLSQITNDVMIVGHLPHLQRLSSLLLCQDEHKKILEFEMGCVICIWKDESGVWAVRWMLTPSIIPA